MKEVPSKYTSTELRQLAEDRLSRDVLETPTGDLSRADIQRLVHELQVHHIELEMQKEELKEAAAEMKTIAREYSDLYDFAPVAYFRFDPNGKILSANIAAAKLLGIERDHLINRRFDAQLCTDDVPVFHSFLQHTFKATSNSTCEVSIRQQHRAPVLIRFRARAAGSGESCLAVATDISGLKQAEKDRLILSKLESTGILAGGIAHDFNNLITVILLNLELAEMLPIANSDLKKFLSRAMEATLKSSELSGKLLTFATGGTSKRAATSLASLIKEAIPPILGGTPVRFECSLPDDLWMVEVDPSQFTHVIQNLVLNAREAMPDGGLVSLRAINCVTGFKEMHHTLQPGGYVRITLSDQGPGIPPHALPKIFDPYFSTKQRGDQTGMGLGLTICHTIVQKHGGTITVESGPEGGATFDIYLPASIKSLHNEDLSTPITEPRSGKILVMDDTEDLREAVGELLKQMGHTVELAADGQSALQAYQQAKDVGQPFDAVILDLTVPDGPGGRETIQKLLEFDPAVRAIVMSGYSKDPVILDHAYHGFKAALVKPFNMADLRNKLAEVAQQINGPAAAATVDEGRTRARRPARHPARRPSAKQIHAHPGKRRQ